MIHTDPSVLHRVDDLLARNLGGRAPAPDADLLESGAMDSLEFAGFLLQLEDEFGLSFTFEDMDLDCFRSAAGIAGFVAGHAR